MTYTFWKYLNLVLTALNIPIGTFVGYQFGSGNLNVALISLGGQMIFTFCQAWIWWKTFEEGKK